MSSSNSKQDLYSETQPTLSLKKRNISTKLLNNTTNFETAVPNERKSFLSRRPWRLSLYIYSSKVELIFEINNSIKIGRSSEGIVGSIDLDLTPFNAFELGVSREHASLILKNDQIILSDHDSSNGTLLNNERLRADESYLVKDGDKIQFGTLDVKINFLTNPYEII